MISADYPAARRVPFAGPILLAVVMLLIAACQNLPETNDVTRIAFGSCNRSDLPQPLWPLIIRHQPDLWVWSGDIVYGDTLDMNELAGKYAAQRSQPGYQKLLERTPATGTWDDHDFGANDAGKDYPQKAHSQQLLLDFLGVDRDSPRRRLEGVYSSYFLGEPPRQVKVLLLDVRYHREPPGPDADILGEAQWQWLENELRSSQAQVNLIVSGTQILPAEHRWERWAAYPRARARLLAMIVSSGKSGVMLVSGDRHFAELSWHKPDDFYPLYEVTSSGLTHFWESMPFEPNRARLGRAYKGLNFGLLEIDWSAKQGPQIKLQVIDRKNNPQLQLLFPLSHLKVAN